MAEDNLAEKYRLEVENSIGKESEKRISEAVDPILDNRLKSTPLNTLLESPDLVPAILSRLGAVRAALMGHGGGIKVESAELDGESVRLVLNLDGACIACGAAPGTLQGIQKDLFATGEVSQVQFSSSLLDTFDDLGREFVLKHGGVSFV